jgi:hypothetical protein
MYEYRDDTLSFDKYEVQEPEPQKVTGGPSNSTIYFFDITTLGEAFTELLMDAGESANLSMVRHGETKVGYCTVGLAESIVGQLFAQGAVHGLSVLASSATMKVMSESGDEVVSL